MGEIQPSASVPPSTSACQVKNHLNPQGSLSSVPKEGGTTIEYKGGVINADGTKGSFLNQQNLVKTYQRVYQAGAEFVHLKTPRDRTVVNAVLIGSVASIAISFAGLYKMSQ